MDKFEADSGRVYVVDDDKVTFDTNLKSVNLMPSAAISMTGYSMVFPDLVKRNGYYYDASSASLTASCTSFITMILQEWGPGLAGNIPEVVLGTVPAGTDYLDVRVRLVRTDPPSNILTSPILVLPEENEWFYCLGGSCPLETKSFFSRMFEVVISGSNVVLRKYQSVRDTTQTFWSGDQSSDITNHPSWTYGGGSSANKGFLVSQRQNKPSTDGGNINKNRGGSNQCSVADNTNYSSTYLVDFLITPGRRS